MEQEEIHVTVRPEDGKYVNIQYAHRTLCTLYPEEMDERMKGLFKV